MTSIQRAKGMQDVLPEDRRYWDVVIETATNLARRYGFLGIADMSVMTGLGMLVFFAVVLFSINIYLLNKGIGIRT